MGVANAEEKGRAVKLKVGVACLEVMREMGRGGGPPSRAMVGREKERGGEGAFIGPPLLTNQQPGRAWEHARVLPRWRCGHGSDAIT